MSFVKSEKKRGKNCFRGKKKVSEVPKNGGFIKRVMEKFIKRL